MVWDGKQEINPGRCRLQGSDSRFRIWPEGNALQARPFELKKGGIQPPIKGKHFPLTPYIIKKLAKPYIKHLRKISYFTYIYITQLKSLETVKYHCNLSQTASRGYQSKGFLHIGYVSHADIEISRTKESPHSCLLLCINPCWEPDIKLDFQNPSLCWVAEDRHPFIRDNLLIVGMDHIIDRKG